NEIPPLWSRIAASTALAAPLGWLLDRATGRHPVAVGVLTGALASALGVRPQKIALGPALGFAVGRVATAGGHRARGAQVASATMLTYRSVSAAVFRDGQVSLLA